MSSAIVLEEVLRAAMERGASDIHIKVPSPPFVRVHGALERLDGFAPIRPVEAEGILAVMLSSLPHSAKHNEFERAGDIDFAYAHLGLGRFRVNAFRQRGSISIVIRLVSFGVPRMDELGLPPIVRGLVDHPDGFVLVTGAVGSGVTTTIAAMIDRVNDTLYRNVITIEDPIEILHSDRRSAISQREVGLDTASFPDGLARILRHDPDMIMVGALPDLATVEAVLGMAESGVLVLTAGTSNGAADAILRIVKQYPEHREAHARATIARSFRGVVDQQLLPGTDGTGRCLVAEVLLGTRAVRDAIATGARADELMALVDLAPENGLALEQSLADSVAQGAISVKTARAAARDPNRLERLLDGSAAR